MTKRRSMTNRLRIVAVLLVGSAALASAVPGGRARAQSAPSPRQPLAQNVVIPQRGAFAVRPLRAPGVRPAAAVQVAKVEVGAVIVEQAATTTLEIHLSNPTPRRLEAELVVPVPDGCVVHGFAYQGSASEPFARILPKDEARELYDAIVQKLRDPALLEFAGYNLIRSSVFPVESHGTQKVRLTYQQLLEAEANRVDFVLPRTEALDYGVPWQITVNIRSRSPISTVYSPSHHIETVRSSPREVSARTTVDSRRVSGPFRLAYVLEQNGLSASLFAYPDPRIDGGYFLLLGGLPAQQPQEAGIDREVILVLDRSGSMNGEKLAQVREAALQIVAGLDDGESFNIITYNEAAELFSPEPVVKNVENERRARAYLERLRAGGGTNIYDALLEALRQKPSRGKLPLVLFLTDGLPTVGHTSEVAIRELVLKENRHRRRVFTFGVGVDVNTPLLERLASFTRAVATFVLPREDVEVKVARVFRRLAGPVLAGAQLRVIDEGGRPEPGRVSDLVPSVLPDLFEGDQLVILGKYRGESPLGFSINGNYGGRERTFQFKFELHGASTRNAFVPRLWASRKIAFLEDSIRDLGATTDTLGANTLRVTDPRLKELVGEIVRLSTEFGILSEYTAFLAREGTDLAVRDPVLAEANENFYRRAVLRRTGTPSVNQDMNRQYQKHQKVLNLNNDYWDENLNRVAVSNVRQVADRAFFRRGGRWVDSRLVETEDALDAPREIEFLSAEFNDLLERLAAQGKQGFVSLRGEIILEVDGRPVLIRAPTAPQKND